MCGIFGWQKNNVEFTDNEILLFKKSLDLINSRGPDNTGMHVSSNLLIGHKRLKILDISEKSNQPFKRVQGKILVYNGEIYNYGDLIQYIDKDLIFKSNNNISDTKVLYEILLKYEKEALNLLDGMFAFAWHDSIKNTLLLARDYLGQKPLYYYHDQNETIYASELSCIVNLKRDLNLSKKNVAKYVKNGYFPGETTPFEKIYKLLPGQFITIENGSLKKFNYWHCNIEQDSNYRRISEDKIVDTFLEKFLNSCEKTFKADVPVGLFLSGGIDSSLVYAAYRKLGIDIQTFTIGFEDKEYDESKNAKKLVDNIKSHNELVIDAEDVCEALENIYHNLDEPHGDPGLINAFLLSKFAVNKVKVGLTGDGADELFGGYASFHAHYLSQKLKFIPSKLLNSGKFLSNRLNDGDGYMNFNFKLKRFLNGSNKKGMFKFINWLSCEDNDFLQNLFNSNLIKEFITSDKMDFEILEGTDINPNLFLRDDYDSLLYFYQKLFLSGFVCHHTDRASMMNSLEVRSPFLNIDIINFANSINKKFKYKNFKTKYILRKSLQKMVGSKELALRKKMGFTMPLARWQRKYFLNDLKNLPKTLNDSTEDLFNHDFLVKLIREHLEGKKNHYQIIHSLLIFSKWRERNSSLNFT